MSRSLVRISKLASAQRQLDAAIRMTFADEDILAVTTVAAAAFRVLRDIRKSRGHKVFADQLRDGVLGVALALARGEMSEEDVSLFQQSELWEVITIAVTQIQTVGVDKKMAELQSLLTVDVYPNAEKTHWERINTASNFLKHADRDPQSFLAAEEVNADQIIFDACNVYLDLMGRLTPEMMVWIAASFVKHNIASSEPAMLAAIMEKLRAIPPEEQNNACIACVVALKEQEESPRRGNPT